MVAAVVGGVALFGTATALGLALAMARTVVSPPRRRKEDTLVLDVDVVNSTVTLERSADAVLPGQYSFWFAEGTGHARLGEIVRNTHTTVTRTILGVDCGDLKKARQGRFNGWLYLNASEFGYEFTSIEIPTSVGLAPAWLIPAPTATELWAVHVHGRAVTRAETLRGVPVFHQAGYTSLVISYRNDGEAPASVDGKYALGDTEWLDVESAVRYALDHGASSVVLVGWSMGGAMALQMATRSKLRGAVRGIVLDSPVVDWATVLRFQAGLAHLPSPIGSAAQFMIGSRWGRLVTGQRKPIDFTRLDLVRGASELRAPILLMHSDDDGYVPSSASHALALARPDLVRMETFKVARHTKLWNYDPLRWNTAIATWLSALDK